MTKSSQTNLMPKANDVEKLLLQTRGTRPGPMKTKEPQELQVVEGISAMAEREEVGQQQSDDQVEVPLEAFVFDSTEAVMLCGREDAHPLLADGPALACEMLDSEVEGESTANTEVAGSGEEDYIQDFDETELVFAQPMAIAGDFKHGTNEKSSPEGDSAAAANISNISAVVDDTMMVLRDPAKFVAYAEAQGEEDATYIQDFDETELVFAQPMAIAGDFEHSTSEKSFSEGDKAAAGNISNISAVVDNTTMILRDPAKFVAALAGGGQEMVIEKGETGSPQSLHEAIAVKMLENANFVRSGGIFETLHTESLTPEAAPIDSASENTEKLQAGDSDSAVNDRITEGCASARFSAIPRYDSPPSSISNVSRGDTTSLGSSVSRSFDSAASMPVYTNKRKYHMNDSEISFMVNQVKNLTERLAISEAARVAAEKRCEDMKKKLELATISAVDTVTLLNEVTCAINGLPTVRDKLAEWEKKGIISGQHGYTKSFASRNTVQEARQDARTFRYAQK